MYAYNRNDLHTYYDGNTKTMTYWLRRNGSVVLQGTYKLIDTGNGNDEQIMMQNLDHMPVSELAAVLPMINCTCRYNYYLAQRDTINQEDDHEEHEEHEEHQEDHP